MLNVLFLKKTYSGMVYTSLVPVSLLFSARFEEREREREGKNDRDE